MNRLLILDGNALLHRAYHALPPLTSPDGKPTGAVYGFVSMLLRLQTDLQASFFAVAFDRPKPTFRTELYKDYQTQRPPMDDALVTQIGTIHNVLSIMNVPMFEADGFEADDVIATIIKKVNEFSSHKTPPSHGIDQIIIVTGDRDILQLVRDDKVLVYMPVKGLSEAKLYGEKDVVERLGIIPTKIPDWKGLCGDPSDNYPGVEGVGPKTATDLVNTFETVEALYEALEKNTTTLSPRVQEKLLRGKQSAYLSKILATIRDDAPVSVDEERLYISTFDTDETKKILFELGFSSLVKRITKKGNVEEKKVVQEKKKSNKDQLDLF